MDSLQEKFDLLKQFTERQLNRADTVINRFINEGLFLSSTSPVEVKHSAWNVGNFLKSKRRTLENQTEYDPANAFLLRYQVAQFLVDLTQLAYDENECIDHLKSMIAKAKPTVQRYFENDGRRAIPAHQFNYTLSRYAYLVLNRWLVADSPELDQMLTELDTRSQNDDQVDLAVDLSTNTIDASYESALTSIADCIEVAFNEQNKGNSVDWDSLILANQNFTSLLQKATAEPVFEADAYSTDNLSGEKTHPDQFLDEVPIDEIVSNNQLTTYSRHQYLDRLKLTDAELLSSLPTRVVKVCPVCFGRSLVERKRPVNEMTTYCQTCRTRVETVYGPYYYQSYTANPAVAITRHRQFLVDRLQTRYFAPEVSYKSTPSSQPIIPPASKVYFFSIATIDEETYKSLEAKYNEFLADYAHRVPLNRVSPDRVSIQICSTGGSVFQVKRLISLINSHKNYTTVTGDVLYSAAFRLYFSLNCPKSLASHAVGMFHLARTVEYVLESGKVLDWSAQTHSDESLAFCRSLGLNGQQIATIAAGGDVYFGRFELAQLDKLSAGKMAQP
ncbi:MAG: hypothetical protein EOO39_02510 [Cytophagaceae bacterium]|nr:MAG: hypothetical protein EOO39_02510 [Cytophagaceae bacterium]